MSGTGIFEESVLGDTDGGVFGKDTSDQERALQRPFPAEGDLRAVNAQGVNVPGYLGADFPEALERLRADTQFPGGGWARLTVMGAVEPRGGERQRPQHMDLYVMQRDVPGPARDVLTKRRALSLFAEMSQQFWDALEREYPKTGNVADAGEWRELFDACAMAWFAQKHTGRAGTYFLEQVWGKDREGQVATVLRSHTSLCRGLEGMFAGVFNQWLTYGPEEEHAAYKLQFPQGSIFGDDAAPSAGGPTTAWDAEEESAEEEGGEAEEDEYVLFPDELLDRAAEWFGNLPAERPPLPAEGAPPAQAFREILTHLGWRLKETFPNGDAVSLFVTDKVATEREFKSLVEAVRKEIPPSVLDAVRRYVETPSPAKLEEVFGMPFQGYIALPWDALCGAITALSAMFAAGVPAPVKPAAPEETPQ